MRFKRNSRRLNGFRLARLAMCDRLSYWERAFVRHVSRQRTLSHRQRALVERLCRQYLEVKP